MECFNRLSYSVWDCKYHIVWIPKYRRKELHGIKIRIAVDRIKQIVYLDCVLGIFLSLSCFITFS
jgi:REP element-mobilizing transposase RayT